MTDHDLIKQLREMQTDGAIMDLILECDIDLLLSIAEAFQPGDAEGLELLIKWLDAMQKESDFVVSPDIMQILVRLQTAAERLEE